MKFSEHLCPITISLAKDIDSTDEINCADNPQIFCSKNGGVFVYGVFEVRDRAWFVHQYGEIIKLVDYRPYRRTNHAISHLYHDIHSRPCTLRGISCSRFGHLGIVKQIVMLTYYTFRFGRMGPSIYSKTLRK